MSKYFIFLILSFFGFVGLAVATEGGPSKEKSAEKEENNIADQKVILSESELELVRQTEEQLKKRKGKNSQELPKELAEKMQSSVPQEK